MSTVSVLGGTGSSIGRGASSGRLIWTASRVFRAVPTYVDRPRTP
jgi:hypothetical protein